MTSLNNKSDRELLEELYLLVEDNRQMIKGLRARVRWQNIIGILKWVIYIGVAVGLYTYLQPFVENITNTYSSLQDSASAIGEIRAKLPNLSSFSF
jgi:hypothetical protein